MTVAAERTLAIEAYTFESHFDLKRFVKWMSDIEFETRKTNLVARLGENGTLFVFDFGALVFVDVPLERSEAIVKALCPHLPREPHAPLRDSFALRVEPGAEMQVRFDSVLLPRLWPLGVECVATVVAQSAAIDYYTEDLQTILDRVEELANSIAKTGRLGASRKDLAKFVASCIASQVEMIHSISLLDKPDFTWEDEAAERLYDVLRHHFEISERYKALEIKLATIREALSQFLEMNATRRALFLETTIMLLIVFEIFMGLGEMFHLFG